MMLNLQGIKDSITSFVTTTVRSYLSYIIPLGMLFLVNASITLNAYDIEKQGILWLHYSQLGQSERESAFPASEDAKTSGMTTKDRETIAAAL